MFEVFRPVLTAETWQKSSHKAGPRRWFHVSVSSHSQIIQEGALVAAIDSRCA